MKFVRKWLKRFLFIIRSVKRANYKYYWQQKNYESYKLKYYSYCNNINLLSNQQISEVKKFWGMYGYNDTVLHNFYYEKTGDFNVKYIPDDLFIHCIEKHYSDWTKADILENKCYYPLLYPNATHPVIFAKRQNGIWTDKNNCLISREQVIKNIEVRNDELFLKYATDSFGGHGVFCIEKK